VLKIENLDKESPKRFYLSFAEIMTLEADQMSRKDLWNWAQRVCQEWPCDCGEGLWSHNAKVQQVSDQEYLCLLKKHCDCPTAGHQGQPKTLDLLSRQCWWDGIGKNVYQ
jgi:hypothetical protein